MEKFVIASDLHGQAEAFKKVVDFYDDDTRYIINGDSVDGPNTKELLTIFQGIDSHLILGNHDSVLLGSLTDISPDRRDGWQQKWLNTNPQYIRYEHNTLKSYGLVESKDSEDTAARLRDVMENVGHLALLQSAKPYFESNGLVIIHAGLDHSRTWASQKPAIREAANEMQESMFTDEWPFLFSFPFANEYKKPYDITTLVTGHSHYQVPMSERAYSRYNRTTPDRVKLGSSLHRGYPLFVYESWTQQVRQFDQN